MREIQEAPTFPCPLQTAEGFGYCMRFFAFVFNNSFIEIYFKYHAIYPFKVYNSMVIYKVLHSQSWAIIITFYFQNIFIIPKRNPVPIWWSLSPSVEQPPIYFSVSIDLPSLDISCKWDHIICGPL